VAICSTCGKKYSKWTTPVSARGVCPDCFESELESERETEAKQQGSSPENIVAERVDEPSTPVSVILVACGLFLIAALVLLLLGGFIASAFRWPLVSTLRGIEWFASLFANIVMAFYCFPAFRRTKDRAFLCIAFAALSFAYGALFTTLFGVGSAGTRSHVSHSQIQLYYATRQVTWIIGLILLSCGIVSLARRATISRGPKAG
jgi:hypothetical protein